MFLLQFRLSKKMEIPRLAAFVILTSHLGAAPPTNLKPATTRGLPLLLHGLD